jgi:hypothetical protein
MTRKAKDTRKPAPTTAMTLKGLTYLHGHAAANTIEFKLETGGIFTGTVDEINALLTALGYHEIAIRQNLMSHKLYIEAKLTPVHCSPASETYWSM